MGNCLYFKSAAQLNTAVSLDAIGKKRVEGFIKGSKAGLKGVIYGVSLEVSMVELVKGIEGAKVDEATQIKIFRDGAKRESSTVVV